MAVSGILLTVDRGCDIVIDSFSEPECNGRQVTTPHVIITATTPTTRDGSVTMATSPLVSTPFSEIIIPVTEITTTPPGTDNTKIAN